MLTLNEKVELDNGVTPERVLDVIIANVNLAWKSDQRCSLGANTVGWLVQEYLALAAARGGEG